MKAHGLWIPPPVPTKTSPLFIIALIAGFISFWRTIESDLNFSQEVLHELYKGLKLTNSSINVPVQCFFSSVGGERMFFHQICTSNYGEEDERNFEQSVCK